jgi:hypothetical protein
LLKLWRKLLRNSLQQGGFHILVSAYLKAIRLSSIFESSILDAGHWHQRFQMLRQRNEDSGSPTDCL